MPLKPVLLFKIWFTMLFWAVPLLAAPAGLYEPLGFPRPTAMVFMKLLGAAFLALLVSYVQGLRALKRGQSAANAVAVGIVSNGLACLVILLYGAMGEYGAWGHLARAYMWVSAAATGLVTLGLVLARRSAG